LVSGHDQVIYFRSVSHAVGSGIPGALLVGWKYGTPFLSLPVSSVPGQSGFWPGDEPVGISAGGTFAYWNLCNDRFIGSADLSIRPTGISESDPATAMAAPQRRSDSNQHLPAGYNSQSAVSLERGLPRIKPMYFAHGDNVGPTIYRRPGCTCHRQCDIAFGPDGQAATPRVAGRADRS
jgi:hypothetical protein